MHPYSPPDLSLPEYVPNDIAPIKLYATFGCLLTAIIGSYWVLFLNHLSIWDKGVASWFLVCGLLHVFFEGYFVFYRSSLLARTDLLAQLWKEYALSDSRYLSEDIFVLAIENITVFIWGPLCFSAVLAIMKRSYYRHPLQILASLAHIYGCLLYFATAWLDGDRHCNPEPFYFWIYYFGMNTPWIIVPGLLIYQSSAKIAEESKRLETIEKHLEKAPGDGPQRSE